MRADKWDMSLDEARRIEAQVKAARIDLTLEGSAQVVDTARRVQVRAHLWGGDSARRNRVGVAIGAAVVLFWFVGALFVPLMLSF